MRVQSSDLFAQEADLLPRREALQTSPLSSILNAIQSAMSIPAQLPGSAQHGGLFHGGPRPLPGI